MKQLLIKCMLIAFSALGCTYADAKEDIKNEIKEIVSELKSLQQDKLKFTTKDFSSFVQNIQNISPEMTPEEIEKLWENQLKNIRMDNLNLIILIHLLFLGMNYSLPFLQNLFIVLQ